MDLSKVTSTLDNTAQIDSTIKTEGHINSQLSTGDKISSEIQNFRTVEIRYLGGETDNIIVTIDNEQRTINASLKDIQFDSAEMFPEIGSNKLIYIDKSTDGIYVWKDRKYVMVGKDYSVQISEIDKQIAEITKNVDQVQKAQVSNSTAIGGLQSDVLTLKSDVAKIDLSNYYKKSETYSKDEVNTLVNNISSFNVKIVSQLPTTDISTTTIYLIAKKDSQSNDYYDEYLYINNKWELIGTTKVDLADYYNKTEIDAKVGSIDEKINVLDTANESLGEELSRQSEKINTINEKIGELEADVQDLQDQIDESGGTTVKVGGVAVAEFNADSKADASTVEQLGTDISSLDASVKSLGENVSQQGTKVTELDAKLVSLATQVATDYYNKTDADGKFATKDQMASQDNTTLQSANSYTDTKIADLVDTAPETLDTLGEVAKAIKDNQDVVNALNSAIGNKVDKTVKINGHSLTQNIVLTAEDVGALSDIPDGYVTTDTLNSAMEKKVDKVDGKGLSTNDYTTADKEKLAGLSNYNDSALSNRITGVENNKANKGTLTNTDLQGTIQAGVYLVDLETCTGLPDNIDDEEIYGGLGTLIASEEGKILLTYNSAETLNQFYYTASTVWSKIDLSNFVQKDIIDVVIGKNATIVDEDAGGVAIGLDTKNRRSYSVSVGANIENNSEEGVAIGYNLQTSGDNSIVIGNRITNTGETNVAIGGSVNTSRSIQLGAGANTQSNTLQIFGDNIYNHETHTLSVQEGHFTKIYLE